MLECLHKENNPYDVFSIKVCKSNNAQSVVGHLPMEISRITKLIYSFLRFLVLSPLQWPVA